ncbi:NADH-ubiquinone oxidoreductase complex I subunit [Novymonas esmeraldas]|uniref:NADH-ubiquinone oxidoreductase complex I subunit n=1 Tax=Novymonas esmeraldas TaxID=1808958 RepID=A0AAW0F0W1_9TRYP
MSALVPSDAVALLYRRYLKATNRIPNVTIRMLLLQQIRSGFRRNRSITSPSAQRELVGQAHKDLAVLEDDRLSRTLYINRLGLVSCLDWEVRRTEYNFRPETQTYLAVVLFFGFGFLVMVVLHTERLETRRPDIAEMVDLMALRLEAGSLEEVREVRERQVRASLEQRQNQVTLEQRVLATFHNAPNAPAPSLRNPEGTLRYERHS